MAQSSLSLCKQTSLLSGLGTRSSFSSGSIWSGLAQLHRSTATIWDAQLTSKEQLQLTDNKLLAEYFLAEQPGVALQNVNMTARVHVNVIPYNGLLGWRRELTSATHTTPTKYTPLNAVKVNEALMTAFQSFMRRAEILEPVRQRRRD